MVSFYTASAKSGHTDREWRPIFQDIHPQGAGSQRPNAESDYIVIPDIRSLTLLEPPPHRHSRSCHMI